MAYLDRHGDDSAPEVAIAHSTLGAVYEGLWAALATGEAFDAGHEASAYADPPATDDESVAVRAEEYRLEAIRHYAEFLLSAVSSYAYSESSRVASRLRALRRREADGPGILCYD